MTAPAPKTLRDWTARRAGGRITVTGTNIETGEADKITNVDTIEPPLQSVQHEVRATDKHKVVHRLIFA